MMFNRHTLFRCFTFLLLIGFIAMFAVAQDATPSTDAQAPSPATTRATTQNLSSLWVNRMPKLHGLHDTLWGGHGLAIQADMSVAASYVFWTRNGVEILNPDSRTTFTLDPQNQQVRVKAEDQPPTTQSVALLDDGNLLMFYTPGSDPTDIPTDITLYRRYTSQEDFLNGPLPPPQVMFDVVVARAIIDGAILQAIYTPDEKFMAQVNREPGPDTTDQLVVLDGFSTLYSFRKQNDPNAPPVIDHWHGLAWVTTENKIDPPSPSGDMWRCVIELVPRAKRTLGQEGTWGAWDPLTPREAVKDNVLFTFDCKITNGQLYVNTSKSSQISHLLTKEEVENLPK
jgi:hypothetical protein